MLPLDELYKQTVATLKAGGVENPALDARVLIAHVMRVPSLDLDVHAITRVNETHLAPLIKRRVAGEPVSRILGLREFWSMTFHITPDVLDPRPDSETGVQAVLSNVQGTDGKYYILDLGTGSGCLLLSLLHELENAAGVGTDSSQAAIKIAMENARSHGFSGRAKFKHTEWGKGIEERFDIIISNPPYIPTAGIEALGVEVKNYDPHAALDGGEDGLDCYRSLAPEVKRLLADDGFAAIEIGKGQHRAVCDIFYREDLFVFDTFRDLAGLDRYILFRK